MRLRPGEAEKKWPPALVRKERIDQKTPEPADRRSPGPGLKELQDAQGVGVAAIGELGQLLLDLSHGVLDGHELFGCDLGLDLAASATDGGADVVEAGDALVGRARGVVEVARIAFVSLPEDDGVGFRVKTSGAAPAPD